MSNPIQKPERPDKPLFFTMMGVFFLLFALAPAYWAFYNFGEYTRTKAFVEELKNKPEQFLTPDEKKEKESRIFFLSSNVDRYRLEMLLSLAGSFLLFGISIVLFIKAFKSRRKKNFYEDLDPRSIPIPNAKIEVKYRNFQNTLLVGVIGFFGLMSILIVYQTLTSPFSTSKEIIVKAVFPIFALIVILLLVFIVFRAKRQTVRSFDPSGITRNDGRHFAWNEFQGVIIQTARNRFGQQYIWREELAFSGGETAWIIPQRIKNYDEISELVSKLPRAVFKEAG